MTKMDGTGPGLSQTQWDRLRLLASDLRADQATWIGGYFTGFADAARIGVAAPQPGATAPAAAPAAAPTRTFTILYGTETGNAAQMAKGLAEKAKALGLAANLRDMRDYRSADLKAEQDLLVVVSTYGEGDPPQPALGFFDFIESRKAPKLPDTRFAVLALGDSTYEFYCQAGKRLDRRLAELGAARLADRIDCDVDEAAAARAWGAKTVELFAAGSVVRAAVAAPIGAPVAVPAVVDQDNPALVPIVENIVLTGRGSSKETRHVELDLSETGLTYEPGDALGIVPRNDPAVVAQLVETLGLASDAPVTLDERTVPLAEALTTGFEIVAGTPRFLASWGELAGASRLVELAKPEKAAERTAFLQGHHVTDIVRMHPVPGVTAAQAVAGLRRLQPRLYSIASSAAAQDGAAHLTVSTVSYELHGTRRFGVTSGELSRIGDTASLPVYVKPNPHFRLPADDRPIIMIGAGTGVAPYRAFLQERELRGATGRAWLFFGERNFRSDFLYQIEWQGFLANGVLSRMDVAFSRDRGGKVYVQHRLREQARDLYAWLEEGAHLYVCGDATGMASDVDGALLDIIVSEGSKSPEAAADYLRQLQSDHRYSRDVY